MARAPAVAALALALAGCAVSGIDRDAASGQGLPAGFVYAAEQVTGLKEEMRYFGSNNFVGRPIDAYLAPRCILSGPAAQALMRAQLRLDDFGLGVKVFDCYRPQRAVAHFARWAQDLSDVARKADYYPQVDKTRLFEDGYIAERSGHSRGSTLDLTLVDAATGTELDMGTGFDLFSPSSWPGADDMTAQQRANRMLLQAVMRDTGFKPYPQEWWHFTLAQEPYPDIYFDFDVR